MGKRFRHIAAALGWLALFLGAQFGAGVVFIFARIFQLSMTAAMAGETPDSLALTQQASEDLLAAVMPVTLVSYAAILAVAALIFLLRRKNPLRECALVPLRGRRHFEPVAAAGGLYGAVNLGLLVIPVPEAWAQSLNSYSAELTNGGVALYIFGAVIAAPFVEELFFRGLFYTRLRRALPRAAAVLISAALFGAVHWTGSPLLVVPALFLGVVNAMALERTGSLWPCVAAHFAANLTSLLPAFFQFAPPILTRACAAGLLAAALAAIVQLYRLPPLPLAAATAPAPHPSPKAPLTDAPRYRPGS